ncbi:MAG: citrate transporter, partial [Lachnospiraceae bacterium]|nr:citrate transporter [Lachnospiraceae bacterium]
MNTFLKTLKNFARQETVLCAAFVLAAVSSLAVPPDAAYGSYIDWNTLLLLFGLMAVMAGYQKLGIFKLVGSRLLSRTKDTR